MNGFPPSPARTPRAGVPPYGPGPGAFPPYPGYPRPSEGGLTPGLRLTLWLVGVGGVFVVVAMLLLAGAILLGQTLGGSVASVDWQAQARHVGDELSDREGREAKARADIEAAATAARQERESKEAQQADRHRAYLTAVYDVIAADTPSPFSTREAIPVEEYQNRLAQSRQMVDQMIAGVEAVPRDGVDRGAQQSASGVLQGLRGIQARVRSMTKAVDEVAEQKRAGRYEPIQGLGLGLRTGTESVHLFALGAGMAFANMEIGRLCRKVGRPTPPKFAHRLDDYFVGSGHVGVR